MMLILETRKDNVSIRNSLSSDEGFTLIEMLLALTILAIVAGLAVLAIPSHDERQWRDNLQKLSASLNTAQYESESSGYPMQVEINASGWIFKELYPRILDQHITQGNALTPDVYKAQSWTKSVSITPVVITLGDEYVFESLRIPIEQDHRQAILVRSGDGYFSLTNP